MSKYTFTFKKDDISVEFTTTDKEAVASQFKIWVDSATEYTKAHPIEEKKTLDEVKTESNTEKPAEVQPEIKQEPDNFDKAQELLKQVEQKDIQVQNEQPQQEAQPEVEISTQETPDMESDKKEEAVPTTSTSSVTINSIQNPTPQEPKAPDFDKVLEQKLENPTFEPETNKDTRFIDFLNAKNTKDKLHYLIITAFYFLQFDRIERFSLKQINSKLMHNISELIDHSIIQEAMNRQLIELIPDLTGASDVSEYRLTEKGEDFFINGLN